MSRAEHPRGHLDTRAGVRTFRGGCTCWPCALRRAPNALADALLGARPGIAVWRRPRRRR